MHFKLLKLHDKEIVYANTTFVKKKQFLFLILPGHVIYFTFILRYIVL